MTLAACGGAGGPEDGAGGVAEPSSSSSPPVALPEGEQLYEPPDVNGWDLGPGWFSTGGMLARMNFAAVLATNQRFALRELARPHKDSPDPLVDFVVSTMSLPPPPV